MQEGTPRGWFSHPFLGGIGECFTLRRKSSMFFGKKRTKKLRRLHHLETAWTRFTRTKCEAKGLYGLTRPMPQMRAYEGWCQGSAASWCLEEGLETNWCLEEDLKTVWCLEEGLATSWCLRWGLQMLMPRMRTSDTCASDEDLRWASDEDFRYICLRWGLTMLMPQMRTSGTHASDEDFRCWCLLVGLK